MPRRIGLSEPETSWPADLLGLPFRRYYADTHLTLAAVGAALGGMSEPRQIFRRSPSSASFEGEVTPDGFRLQRVIRYRNLFLPVIIGRFEKSLTGARVAITMRPGWFGVAIMLGWIVFIAWAMLTRLSAPHARFNEILILPVLLVGYLLVSISFGLEARWARELLSGALSKSPY